MTIPLSSATNTYSTATSASSRSKSVQSSFRARLFIFGILQDVQHAREVHKRVRVVVIQRVPNVHAAIVNRAIVSELVPHVARGPRGFIRHQQGHDFDFECGLVFNSVCWVVIGLQRGGLVGCGHAKDICKQGANANTREFATKTLLTTCKMELTRPNCQP